MRRSPEGQTIDPQARGLNQADTDPTRRIDTPDSDPTLLMEQNGTPQAAPPSPEQQAAEREPQLRFRERITELDSKLTTAQVQLYNQIAENPSQQAHIEELIELNRGYINDLNQVRTENLQGISDEALNQYIDEIDRGLFNGINGYLAEVRRQYGIAVEPETGWQPSAERTQRPEQAEILQNPERAPTPVQPAAPADRARARTVLTTLATNGDNPIVDRTLDERVTQLERNIELPPVSEQDLQALNPMIAAGIRERWTPGQRRERLNMTDQDVIAEALRNGENLDDLFREAYVRNRLREANRQAREDRDRLLEGIRRRNNRGGFSKFTRWAGGSALGIIGGTVIRHLTQQGLIAAGVQSANWVSAGGGLVAGAVVGGVAGGIRGFYRAKDEVYAGQQMIDAVQAMRSNGEINDNEARALFEQLLRDNKVRGKEAEAYAIIESISAAQAERELAEALENLQPIEGETEDQKRHRLALAITELQRRRVNQGGSELLRTEEIQRFLDERRIEIRNKTLSTAGKNALTWAGAGGVFGFLFPAPGLDSQINAQNIANEPLHIDSAAEANDLVAKIKTIAANHGTSPQEVQAANQEIGRLLSGYNVKDMASSLMNGNEYLAKQIAYRLGVNLSHGMGPDGTLLDVAKNYLEAVKLPDGSINENGVRGLFHLISHPDTIREHMGQFQDIVRDNLTSANGHDFTAKIIHGGTTWWWPFTGGPFMSGGEMSNDMSASAREYLTSHPDAPKNLLTPLRHLWLLNTETPWFPFAMWLLSSSQARWLSEKGKNGVDTLKGYFDKVKGKDKEKEGSKEKKEYLTDTGEESFDQRIFEADNYRDDPTLYQKLKKQLGEFKKHIPRRHGQFFFVKDGDRIRAFRLWPHNIARAKLSQKADINKPQDQNVFGDEGTPDYELLHQGSIQVKEYTLNELADTPIDGKTLKNTWDLPQWGTKKKVPFQLDYRQVFRPGEESDMKQLFINPEDVHKYAVQIRNGNAYGRIDSLDNLKTIDSLPAEKTTDSGQEGASTETNAKTETNQSQEGQQNTGQEAESQTQSPEAGQAPQTPETPQTPESQGGFVTNSDQLRPGMEVKDPSQIITHKLLERLPDGSWRFAYSDPREPDLDWQSGGTNTIDPQVMIDGKWRILHASTPKATQSPEQGGTDTPDNSGPTASGGEGGGTGSGSTPETTTVTNTVETAPAPAETARTRETIENELQNFRLELEKPAPTVQIIPDIHGDLKNLDEVLNKQGPADKIIFLGDLIDRGPNSLGVLERVKSLVESGKAEFLLGNHEALFIAAMEGTDTTSYDLWLRNGGSEVVKEVGEMPVAGAPDKIRQNATLKEWAKWLKDNGKVSIIQDGHLFVHAGLPIENNGKVAKIHRDKTGLGALRSMENDIRSGRLKLANIDTNNSPLWVRPGNWTNKVRSADGILSFLNRGIDSSSQQPIQRIVYGHTPSADGSIRNHQDGRVLGIDTALSSAMGGHGGALYLDKDGIRFVSRDLTEADKNPVIEQKDRKVADTDRGKEIEKRIAELETELAAMPAAPAAPTAPEAVPATETPKYTDINEALAAGLQETNGQGTFVLDDNSTESANPIARLPIQNQILASSGNLININVIKEIRNANGDLLWKKP